MHLQDQLHKTTKSKHQKTKADELCITFEGLNDFPYVMWQSTWELDWDLVKGLYDFCIGILAYIVNDKVLHQWWSTASAQGAQCWTSCDADNLLYSHAVLLLLVPINLLDPPKGREQNKQETRLAQYIYSTVVVFIQPGQTLIPVREAADFLKDCHGDIICEGHSCRWCILCKLPSYEMLKFFPVIPHMPFLALLVSS